MWCTGVTETVQLSWMSNHKVCAVDTNLLIEWNWILFIYLFMLNGKSCCYVCIPLCCWIIGPQTCYRLKAQVNSMQQNLFRLRQTDSGLTSVLNCQHHSSCAGNIISKYYTGPVYVSHTDAQAIWGGFKQGMDLSHHWKVFTISHMVCCNIKTQP